MKRKEESKINNIEKFKNFLKENNIRNEVVVENEKIKVKGILCLSNTKIKEIPANLTVGGRLDLRNTLIEKLPNNLTVGGSLDLSNTKIKELPNDLMAQGYICGFNGDNTISAKKVTKGFNKERNYIYFDGILWGNVKSVKKKEDITIYKTPLGYCAEEKGLAAHGRNLKEAIEDLTVKKLKDTDVSEIVKEIKRTGKVTRAQYRAMTGACRLGTESFCRKHHIEDLDEISLEELRKILTPDNYGAERFWRLIDGE